MTDRSLDEVIDEVVLGLASETDIARIEQLAAQNPDIAAKLELARSRFHSLDETADELDIPDALWDRIVTGLDRRAPEEPEFKASADIINLESLPQAMRRWRAAAISSLAATIALAIALGLILTSSIEPTVIAVLLDAKGQPVALIEGNEKNKTQITLLEAAQVPDGQVMQVWTKPNKDGAPVSLGLLPSSSSRALAVEGLPPPQANQLYEITFEPRGGSPTNLPTGPILGKGFAKAPVL